MGTTVQIQEIGAQIERLTREAVKAAPVPPVVVTLPGDKIGIAHPDGTLDVNPAPVKPRTGGLLTLASAAMLAFDLVRRQDISVRIEPIPAEGTVAEQLQAEVGGALGEIAKPFIGPAEAYVRLKTGCKPPQRRDERSWEERLREDAYGVLEVEVVLDAADRCDQRRENRAALTLPELRTLRALQWLETQRPMLDQRQLIALCRTELGMGGQQSPGSFVTQMRTIKKGTNNEVVSRIGHGKDSLGGEIKNEIVGNDGDLPEQIAVRFEAVPASVLGREPLTLEVACTVVVYPEPALFQIIPLPGELDRVKAAIADDVAEALAEQHSAIADNDDAELHIYRGWLSA